jgi:cobalt-zinc-cadmium efflux system membrane fusion protein
MRRTLLPLLFVLAALVAAPLYAEEDHHDHGAHEKHEGEPDDCCAGGGEHDHDHDHGAEGKDGHDHGGAAGKDAHGHDEAAEGHDDHDHGKEAGAHDDHGHGKAADAHDDHGHEKAADSHDDHGDSHGDADEHGHGGHDDHHDEFPTGPNGGRLVEGGGLEAEIAIFETGVAPQLRVWIRDGDTVVDPSQVKLAVTLKRLAREPERLTFQPRGDFLLADQTIGEPHSFRLDIEAHAGGKTLRGGYDQIEARVTISAAEAAAGAVTSAVAGPRDLGRSLQLTGRIGIPSDRLAELHPRFAGVVREASGTIGDRVTKGQTLAVLESSATLARFALVSPHDGVLLDRRAVVGGSAADDDKLYIVADLSQVWADLDVYGEDTHVVHVGETVTIRDEAHRDDEDAVVATAKISYVSPLRDVHTQTTLARAVLPNADGRWAPGAFVSATIDLDEPPAKVAVPPSALQTWMGQTAVFVHAEGVWEARPVRIGRSGDEWVELLSGVDAGTTVATGNTFLLRAEVEKAGASHDH